MLSATTATALRLSTLVVEGTGEAHTPSGQPTGTLYAWGSLGHRAVKVRYTPRTGRVVLVDQVAVRTLARQELQDLLVVLERHSQSLPWVDEVTTQLLAGVEAALASSVDLSELQGLGVVSAGGMVMLSGQLRGRPVELVLYERSQRLAIVRDGARRSERPLSSRELVGLCRALAPYVAGTRADWAEFAALQEAAMSGDAQLAA